MSYAAASTNSASSPVELRQKDKSRIGNRYTSTLTYTHTVKILSSIKCTKTDYLTYFCGYNSLSVSVKLRTPRSSVLSTSTYSFLLPHIYNLRIKLNHWVHGITPENSPSTAMWLFLHLVAQPSYLPWISQKRNSFYVGKSVATLGTKSLLM